VSDPLVLFPRYQYPPCPEGVLAINAALRHLRGFPWAMMGPQSSPDATRRKTASPTIPVVKLRTPPDLWNAGEDGRQGYNPLMLSRGLYEQIAARGHTHVLIYQDDAIVFRNELLEWCDAGIDYIGAPHAREAVGHLSRELDDLGVFAVGGGNGGLSLRNVDACLRVLDGMPEWLNERSYYRHVAMNEDVFWSFKAPEIDPTFRVATLEQSLAFSWEAQPALCYLLNRWKLPMGAHGYERYDPEFWESLGGVSSLALSEEPPEPAPSPAPS
jgi:Protein of unknown function (DUF5672)